MNYPAVVVDGRVFQTNTWYRGMGRYSLGLISGLSERSDSPRVIVLLAKDMPPLDSDRKETIERISPGVELVYLDIVSGGSKTVEQKNNRTVDKFVRRQNLMGSIFLIPSLFTFEYSPFCPATTINTCIFHDIIPFKHWDTFNTLYGQFEYFRRFRYIYMMDKIFSNSNYTKNDLINYLGFTSEDIINISGADAPASSENTSGLSPRSYKYILLPGGDAPHKNMLRAIRGFDIFNAELGDSYRLLITSFYSEESKLKMRQLSPNIELVGQVSDEELENLYKHAEVVLFPSLDEGLGMPVLEAVRYNKKISCSSIEIFKELSKDAFHFFDPLDVDDIANSIKRAILDSDDNIVKKYDKIRSRFSWQRSAKMLMESHIEKRIYLKSNEHHSIIVEQDSSFDLVREIGSVVRQNFGNKNLDLFINTVDEDNSKTPIIFNHILLTRDIVDSPKKSSKKSRTIIFTKDSKYSRAFLRDTDKVTYINTNSKDVARAFREAFSRSV